jgi:glucosamine 6-phosphate synthetase-like amidotransferase/phosphosugar isomerase protein
MCGLYGFINRGSKGINTNGLVKGLAVAAQVRGSDATGIAYNVNNHLCVVKAAVPATDFVIDIPKGVTSVIGHTRATTQGTQWKNQNNHPFIGATRKTTFALAHNGVLDNDYELRYDESLPNTDIETDSYVAVQLLEKYAQSDDTLTINSVVESSQLVQGMFAFSILESNEDFWLIRNDSPIHMVYYKKHNLYVYGSTEAIVKHGLKSAGLGDNYTVMRVEEGRIIHIDSAGKFAVSTFTPQRRFYSTHNASKYAIANGGSTTTPYTTTSTRDYFRQREDDYMIQELIDFGLTYEEGELLVRRCNYRDLTDAIRTNDVHSLLYDELRLVFQDICERGLEQATEKYTRVPW